MLVTLHPHLCCGEQARENGEGERTREKLRWKALKWEGKGMQRRINKTKRKVWCEEERQQGRVESVMEGKRCDQEKKKTKGKEGNCVEGKKMAKVWKQKI